MENCLMCLQINRKTIDRIKVDSPLWRKHNVKNIIEKHFWTLETLEPRAWICTNCWQELFSFHLFYSRVEEVHTNLVTVIEETDDETSVKDLNYQDDDDDENFALEDFIIETGPNIMDSDTEPDEANESIYSETNTLNETTARNHDEEVSEQIRDESSQNSCTVSEYQQNEPSHDSDTVSEYKQNEQTLESKNRALKVQQEHDEFISANFQLSCDLCQISLENFTELRAHFTEEHNALGYSKCCGNKFNTRTLLIDHIKVHLNPDYFKCQHCDKVLATRIILDKHMKMHADYLEKIQPEYPYSCDICGKCYKQQSKFETHKLSHETVQEFPCTECDKICDTAKQLYSHKRAHFVKFLKVCEICGMTLHDRGAFVTHMNVHENKKPTPASCDICGLILANNRALRGHKRRQHPEDGIKEYPCHLCSKVSPNRRALRIHIRFAHEMTANHKCTMCDKAFKRPEGLREHVATHTGTALYTCSWCPKTFISKANMHKHHKTAHTEQWEEERYQKYSEKYNLSAVTDVADVND